MRKTVIAVLVAAPAVLVVAAHLAWESIDSSEADRQAITGRAAEQGLPDGGPLDTPLLLRPDLLREPHTQAGADVQVELSDPGPSGDDVGPADLLAVATSLHATLAGDEAGAALVGSLSRQADLDPRGAFQVALALSDDTIRREALEEIFEAWVRDAPQEAIATVRALRASSQGTELIALLATQLAEVAPGDSLALLDEFPEGERADVLVEVFRRWSEIDPRAALSTGERFLDPHERLLATGEALAAWAGQDFEMALGWCLSHQESVHFLSWLDRVSEAWVEASPRDAADFLGGLTDSDQADSVIERAARIWARNDPDAVFDWANRLSPPTARIVARGMVAELCQDDCRTAAEYAVALEDAAPRRAALDLVMARWSADDSAAAAAWLATSGAASLSNGDSR